MTTCDPYGPVAPRIYDLIVHGETGAEAGVEEMEFLHWAFAERARRPVCDILDAGCGTGFYLVPLAREGCRLTGLDVSPGMLAECERKLAEAELSAAVRLGAMEQIEQVCAFDAVLCLGDALCYLLETDRILDALRRFRRALRVGGLLVIENDNLLSPEWQALDGPVRATVRESGLKVDWQTEHRYEDFTSHYIIEDRGTITSDSRTHRFHTVEKLRAMTAGEVLCYLDRAGFVEARAYPGFCRDRRRETSSEQIVFTAVAAQAGA